LPNNALGGNGFDSTSPARAAAASAAAAAANVVVLLEIYSLSYANGFGQMSIFQGENTRSRGKRKSLNSSRN
jgi:hypothetical protein